jgi:transcriptional regulator with XRE-family HTH domain
VELSNLLQKEGFTQTQKAISKWEKNAAEPSVTIFFTLCRILGVTNMYEAYFGENPDDPLSSLSEDMLLSN